MYQSEFDKNLQKGAISNSFVFYGESLFLIDRYIKMLSNIEDASILNYNQDEYDFNSAKAHLSQASLFGGRNVLIIKTHKKVPKKELDELIELTKKQPGAYFIYGYYGVDHKSSNGSGTAFKKTKDKLFSNFHVFF